MTSRFRPVSDWATDLHHADLDHADPDDNPNVHAILAALGDGGCPAAHSDRYAGSRSGSSPLHE